MSVRKATALWEGTLKEGKGKMEVSSGAFAVPFSFHTRFADEPGTNPEELIGAAHAGCFSMFMSAVLTDQGFPPTSIKTVAKVHLGNDETGPMITQIDLVSEATIPNINTDKFQEIAALSKANCPISRALNAVPEVTLDAKLV